MHFNTKNYLKKHHQDVGCVCERLKASGHRVRGEGKTNEREENVYASFSCLPMYNQMVICDRVCVFGSILLMTLIIRVPCYNLFLGRTVFYGQYKCTGPGASFAGRVSWSRELTDSEAKPFTSLTFIDGSEWIKM